jgi:hypothetical protein
VDVVAADPISPELALVDPTVRSSAIAALPPLGSLDVFHPRPSLVPPQARRRITRSRSAAISAAGHRMAASMRVALFDVSLLALLVLVIIVVVTRLR